MTRTSLNAWAAVALLVTATACGTGIENTEHVTDKDVARVIQQVDSRRKPATLTIQRDSLPVWRQGKQFVVTDNQLKLLFERTPDYDLDTVTLAGHTLLYRGYDTGSVYDNRQTVNIRLQDAATGNTYTYRTGKTLPEFRSTYSIPMLIDMDLVHGIGKQICGRDYYVMTPIWYDVQSQQMMAGRQFIRVYIDSVLPGNKVMPLRVLFTAADTHQHAMVWMTDNASTMRGRDFDALFVQADPHLDYPAIGDANWTHITRGEIVEGMTKEECRLALGAPKRTSQNPDQGGMREYWYYDGGSYLFFVDGLLRQFRR